MTRRVELTPELEEALRALRAKGMGIQRVAFRLGVAECVVIRWLYEAGLPRVLPFNDRGLLWSAEEIAELRTLWPSLSEKEIGLRLGRSKNSVSGQAYRLRLPKK